MPASRKAACRRNRKQRGGALGSTYGFVAPTDASTLRTMNNPLLYSPSSSCMAQKPGGFLPGNPTDIYAGLPGMKGGKRSRKVSKKNRRNARKTRNRKQRGGSYSVAPYDGTVMGLRGNAGLAPIAYRGCDNAIESNSVNTLNKVGGYLWDSPKQSGGAYVSGADIHGAYASMNSGAARVGTDTPSVSVPTAGYTQLSGGGQSVIQTGAGTYEMVNAPMNAREMNQACLKTGGGRRKSSQKRRSNKSKKNRSNRKRT